MPRGGKVSQPRFLALSSDPQGCNSDAAEGYLDWFSNRAAVKDASESLGSAGLASAAAGWLKPTPLLHRHPNLGVSWASNSSKSSRSSRRSDCSVNAPGQPGGAKVTVGSHVLCRRVNPQVTAVQRGLLWPTGQLNPPAITPGRQHAIDQLLFPAFKRPVAAVHSHAGCQVNCAHESSYFRCVQLPADPVSPLVQWADRGTENSQVTVVHCQSDTKHDRASTRPATTCKKKTRRPQQMSERTRALRSQMLVKFKIEAARELATALAAATRQQAALSIQRVVRRWLQSNEHVH